MKKSLTKFGRFSKKGNNSSLPDIDELSEIGLNEPNNDTHKSSEPKRLVEKRPKPQNNAKPLLLGLAFLTLAALAYFLFKLLAPPATVSPIRQIASERQQTTESAKVSETTTAQPLSTSDSAQDKSDLMIFDPDSIPDPNEILNAELPANDSLAKEEIDRLNDEHDRLIAQEKLAKQQADLMAELTQKKEEQIKLLEKQIDQLQSSQNGTN
ncbi:MAG: hypothetical protein Q4P13_04455 [Psychrobacter sp.]|nr:hypothetical protein [Psychrobacter sp.]